jgi:hypothetical protein
MLHLDSRITHRNAGTLARLALTRFYCPSGMFLIASLSKSDPDNASKCMNKSSDGSRIGLAFYFNSLSLRELVPTSLKNALVC